MNRFNVSSSNVSDIINALNVDGYVIVENVLSAHKLDELRTQLEPKINSRLPDTTGNPFMGTNTVRFGRLPYRYPETHEIIQHPLTKQVLDGTLLKLSPRYKLSFTGIMHLMEGQKAQNLHSDNVPFWNPSPSILVATMWAVNDFTRENGATVFVPGSHRWDSERVPKDDEIQVAEMPAGSVLFYVGNLIHGAGQCSKGFRTGLSLQYAVSWLAGDEIQLASNEDELRIARTFGDDLLRLMGYDTVSRNWGTVDDLHPLNALRNDSVNRTLAEPGFEFENGVVRKLRLIAE